MSFVSVRKFASLSGSYEARGHVSECVRLAIGAFDTKDQLEVCLAMLREIGVVIANLEHDTDVPFHVKQ